jgi:ferredoxin
VPEVFQVKVNRHLCTGCNVCVVSCPINFNKLKEESKLTRENAVLLVKNGVAIPIYIEKRDANCDGCGVCQESCPQEAITIHFVNV